MSAIRNLFRGFRGTRTASESDTPAESSVDRWVVAGLGNPGEEYARSRHNLGFAVLDLLAKQHHASFNRKKFQGVLGEAEIAGYAAILVKPQTYYNLSGDCLAPVLGYYKSAPATLIVIHDEMDLDLGRVKLKFGGGGAGNNGIMSIIRVLGTGGFIRVRIGVGKPAHRTEGKDHVLRALNREEREALEAGAARACESVEAIIREGIERAMGRFNQ